MLWLDWPFGFLLWLQDVPQHQQLETFKKKKKDKLLTSPRKGHTVKLQVERKTCGPAIVEFEGGESMALLFIGEFKTNE